MLQTSINIEVAETRIIKRLLYRAAEPAPPVVPVAVVSVEVVSLVAPPLGEDGAAGMADGIMRNPESRSTSSSDIGPVVTLSKAIWYLPSEPSEGFPVTYANAPSPTPRAIALRSTASDPILGGSKNSKNASSTALVAIPTRGCSPGASLDDAARKLRQARRSALLIVADGRPTGIVTACWSGPGKKPLPPVGHAAVTPATPTPVPRPDRDFGEFPCRLCEDVGS